MNPGYPQIDLFCEGILSHFMEVTTEDQAKKTVSFENTEIGFRHLSNAELNFSYWIFRIMASPSIVKLSSSAALLALRMHLPIKWVIKATIFRQFCGGEDMEDCGPVVAKLDAGGVGAILDYSVEGAQKESHFDETAKELEEVIRVARDDDRIPIACMKVTGIGRFSLLEKASTDQGLSQQEKADYARIVQRLNSICKAAYECGTPLYIDAEESWIQVAIDRLVESMMRQYNKERAIVFTTLQMYRHDKIAHFQKLIGQAKKESFKLGVKIVRGAYLEKENKRAAEMGYQSPMQTSKPNTDKDYNGAMTLALENLDVVEVCAGTHNEESCLRLIAQMDEKGLPRNHKNIYFSQLYGMSDYMSYNLSAAGCNITKYLPYGPVKSAMPYLIRRAQENTSIAGQMGKELRLIVSEKKRRKAAK